MPYLYAIVGRDPVRELSRGAFDEELSLLDAGSVSAVVGDLAVAPTPSRKGLGGHDRVVRVLVEQGPTLPARFGQLVEEDELRRALLAREGAFREALELVDGCVQMTLRLALDDDPAALPKEAPRPSSGRAYLEERRARRSPPALDELRRALSSWMRAEKTQIAGEPHALASLYQLVPRDSVEDWQKALATVRESSGARVQVSGPWPPYAFVPEVS